MATSSVPTEAQEAKTLVAYMRLRGLKFMHIPSETGGSPEARRRAIRMKQMGTVPGFPDYLVIAGGKLVAIELKRKKGGVVSKDQREWLMALNAAGIDAVVARGADEAIEYLDGLTGKKPAKEEITF